MLLLASTACQFMGRVRVRPPPVGVSVSVPAPPPPPSVSARVSIQASAPQVSAGVVAMTPTCTPGAPEVLNGLDDNCNGQVDEGYVQSGAVQVTLGWSTGADIDFYVTDPGSETLSYQNTNSASGGHLDRDARGACTDGQTTENVYWPSGISPRGTYQVAVHYFSDCQAAAVTPIVLSIMVGGQPLGVYQYNLSPGQHVMLASFNIP